MKNNHLKKKPEDLVSELKNYGYKFTSFETTKLGDYKKEDADWNDKDLLHIKNVHSKIDAVNTYVSDEFASTIQFIKIPMLLNIEFPIVVLNYDTKDYFNTFVATFGPYILIMDKKTENKNQGSETHQTFYCGTNIFFFKLLLPIVKIFLKKNNQFTYSEDLPMRIQRHNLRKNNHFFRDENKRYSYLESLNLKDQKIFFSGEKKVKINLSDINQDKIVKKENSGLLNFHIIKNSEIYKFYSSICYHEGAYLCPSQNSENIKCPWHGIIHKPVLKVKNNKVISSNNTIYDFNLNWPMLEITLKNPVKAN